MTTNDHIVDLVLSHDRPACMALYCLPYDKRISTMAVQALLIEAESTLFNSSDAMISKIRVQWWIDALQAGAQGNHALLELLRPLHIHHEALINALCAMQDITTSHHTMSELQASLSDCYAPFYHVQFALLDDTQPPKDLQALRDHALKRALWRLMIADARGTVNDQRYLHSIIDPTHDVSAILQDAFMAIPQPVAQSKFARVLTAPNIAMRPEYLTRRKNLLPVTKALQILFKSWVS